MNRIKLKINRTGSFMSRHTPYEIWFQDGKIGTIITGSENEFMIPPIKGVLHIRENGSRLAFHTIEKSVVIFPEHINATSNTIICCVTAKLNWLGVISLGLLAPIRTIDIKVTY